MSTDQVEPDKLLAAKTAFVTGAGGFVGRNLCSFLLRERGYSEVRGLVRSEAARAAVEAAGAAPVQGDLAQVDQMREGMRGADVVYHLAAKVGTFGPWAEFERDTVQGTANALKAAREAGVPVFVHVGTEAVLVGGPMVDVDETTPIPPDSDVDRDVYPYSRAKAAAEQLVLRGASEAGGQGMRLVVCRPRFIWGAGDTVLLPGLLAAARSGTLKLPGGGQFPTSTCHVRNVCEGLELAARRGRNGEVYFLTDAGEPPIFRDFVGRMLATRGLDPDKVIGSVPAGVARVGAFFMEWFSRTFQGGKEPTVTRQALALIGVPVTVVDKKARRELGYVGHVSMDDGLREMEAEQQQQQ